MPEARMGSLTPRGAPVRSQSASYESGSPASLEKARKNSAFKPGPVGGLGSPTAAATLTRSSSTASAERSTGGSPPQE